MTMLLPELFTHAGTEGLPPRPDESIWPYLDAAVRCVERFGWARTSVKDIAAEVGVERTTVYRRVGSMDDVFRLLIAREVHLLLESLPNAMPDNIDEIDGPAVAVEVLAASIEHCLANPVINKIRIDEPEVAGGFLSQGMPDLISRIALTIAPGFRAAMDAGLIAHRDPVILGDWIARIGLSVLLVPPPGDLRVFLGEILDPVLRVATADATAATGTAVAS